MFPTHVGVNWLRAPPTRLGVMLYTLLEVEHTAQNARTKSYQEITVL